MPAGITHLTFSRVALDHLTSETGIKAKDLLGQQFGPYLAGSVAPDIPYMGNFEGNPFTSEYDDTADKFHQHDTLQIPFLGLELAKKEFLDGNIDYAKSLCAFYIGYLSHAVADGTIHPFIRDMVGDYSKETKTAHRALEMKLDVLVAKKYLGVEVNGVSIQEQLNYMRDCEFRERIYASFSELIKQVYQDILSLDELLALANGMESALDLAEGHFFKWYNIYLADKAMLYMDLDDVEARREKITTYSLPKDSAEKGNLQNYLWKDKVDFFKDADPQYFKVFPGIIEAAYEFVFLGGPHLSSKLQEFNFDNGRLAVGNNLKDKAVLYV